MKSGRAESSWNDIQCTYCGTGETAKLCISCCRFCCRLRSAAAFAVFTATETSLVLWSANSHLPLYGPTFTSYHLWALLLPTCLGHCWFLDRYCKQHFLDLTACMTENCLRVSQLHSLLCAWWGLLQENFWPEQGWDLQGKVKTELHSARCPTPLPGVLARLCCCSGRTPPGPASFCRCSTQSWLSQGLYPMWWSSI